MRNDLPVRVDMSENGVATVTLDRPKQLNAIDPALAAGVLEAATGLMTEPTLRLVVLRGNGSSFCAGGDVLAMNAQRHDLIAFLRPLIDSFHAGVLALRRLPVPVIASVHGAIAGGGFSLAMACDLVIATRSARFVVAYPKLATSSDGGLSYFLRQRLGAVRALETLTIDGVLSSKRAHALGLINRVAEDETLVEETRAWTQELLAVPRYAMHEFKSLIVAQDDDALAAHLEREKTSFLRCAATAEFLDKLEAFCTRQPAL